MSKMAEAARAANRAKAHRMANGSGPGDDPSRRIDASGWQEPTNMHLNAKVGARPVSRNAYKRGGVVSGECAPKRADRKARASGGRGIVDDFVNRNAKTANEREFGKPHEGGWASGGATNFRHRMMHPDEAADKRLIKHMVKPAAMRTGKRDGGGKWIAGAIRHPGALHKELGVPKGENIPAKKLNKAAHSDNPTLAKRANLAKTLGRMHKAHGGSATDPAGMRPKGGRIAKKHGGKAKGRTNIVIGIHAGQPPQQPLPMAAPMKPPMPQAPPPAPPGGMPPGMSPTMGMPMQPGLQGAPQFPRASGGRAGRKEGGPVVGDKFKGADPDRAERVKSIKDLPAGTGGGLGRLAKRSIAQRTFVRPA